jgi:hypothetical protein
MTENINLASLRYKFHRLTERHKELILKVSEMLVQATAVPEKGSDKGLSDKADRKSTQ